MSAADIASILHARDGQRERCPWCRRELADETDDHLCIDAAEAEGRSVGGEGAWLCWSPFGGLGCDDDNADSQLLRAEAAERIATERLDLLADCLEQIGLRDERGLWDGALSTAEELIEHLVEAGRLVRVPGDGPARWEWGGSGWGSTSG